MTTLIILKEHLQKILNESTETRRDFHYAIEDAIYACSLGTESALLNWSTNWINDDHTSLPEDDIQYAKGVQSVADAWESVKNGEMK